jgi:hypothetical protein
VTFYNVYFQKLPISYVREDCLLLVSQVTNQRMGERAERASLAAQLLNEAYLSSDANQKVSLQGQGEGCP